MERATPPANPGSSGLAPSTPCSPFRFSSAAPLVAGLSGGAVSTALLYPLDLIKVRLQVNEDPIRSAKTSRRRTIMCTVRGVIRHEGVLGLYQGLTPALVGSAASWGGYFFLYEGIKRRWVERRREERDRRRRRQGSSSSPTKTAGAAPKRTATTRDYSKDMHVDEEIDLDTTDDGDCALGPAQNFAAACAAGAAMVLVTNPVWLIKTRMQLQMRERQKSSSSGHGRTIRGAARPEDVKPPYRSMTDAARTIVREEGPLALYKGAVPALMLVSHGGVQFVAYEFLKERFGTYTRAARSKKDERGQERSGAVEKLQDSLGYLAMGAVSKMIASTVTYPLQVIKARLQQRSQSVEITEGGELAVVRREYGGVVDCVVRIFRNEGPVGFFKGCIPNAIRVAPSAAITFVTYETVMDILS